MASKLQVRRGLASEWTANNPILGIGEQGWEIDNNKMKFGDGVTEWNLLPYFADGASYAGMAAEILASESKATPVDGDLVGIVDSADGSILKNLSWANIKATLKFYFDTLYILGSTDDLTEGTSNLYNKLPSGGLSGQIPAKNSATDFDVSWIDPPNTGIQEAPNDGQQYARQSEAWSVVSGGSGHVIKDVDDSSLPEQGGLRFFSANDELVVEDDDSNDNTNYYPKIRASMDYDATGEVEGDVIARTSGGYIPNSTAPFDDILSTSEMVSADSELSVYLRANHSILGIKVKSDGTNANTLVFSSTSGGSDIGTVIASATFEDYVPLDKRWFSKEDDTSIFISGVNAGTIELEFLFISGVFSDKPSSGGGGGEPSDGDKGDITVSGSGLTWGINTAAVDMNMINASGTASSTTYLRGDGVWATPDNLVNLDPYSELTYGSTVTWDTSIGLNKKLTSTGDFILSLTSLSNGMSGDLRINATASTNITLPSGSLVNGTITSLIGVYHLTWVYDGTNLEFNIADYA